MNFLRFLIMLLLAAVLLLTSGSLYFSSVVTATTRTGRPVQSKKPVQFHYVCPMHDDVTSKKPGTCPKCKMKLVRKPLS